MDRIFELLDSVLGINFDKPPPPKEGIHKKLIKYEINGADCTLYWLWSDEIEDYNEGKDVKLKELKSNLWEVLADFRAFGTFI